MKNIIVGQDDRVGKWVCERTKGTWSPQDSKAVGLEKDGKIIAGVIFDHFNGASMCLHIAGEGRWLSFKFIHFCFHYAFKQANVHKVIGLVPENNLKARRFDEHLGFVLETRIKDACPGGDLLIYSMTEAQCRWLRGDPWAVNQVPRQLQTI